MWCLRQSSWPSYNNLEIHKQKMENKIINPWKWQDSLDYSPVIVVKKTANWFYIVGTGSIDENESLSQTSLR